MAEVRLERITWQPRGAARAAVREVTLTARDGECLALHGPPGGGNSALLRLVAGLEAHDGGEIFIGGRRVDGLAPAERGAALIVRNSALYPHLTVYQNLGHDLAMRRAPRAEIDRRARDAAETLGIDPLLNRMPRALSPGERWRVLLGRALARRPEVLLLDDPLGAMDARARRAEIEALRGLLPRLGVTILYATASAEDAAALGDRIAFMREGRIERIEEPQPAGADGWTEA